ncbi:hypothetical protein IV203_001028 [Nitzschia inconspicua]|uniref:Uncharacterized protein n=1 Tax=Nitzschia inconspicua TaxID=303405 RepID=A0A9K3L6D1_9STRA|nr:hypothetical protein IV203_001028 [Nitzschia inconspicua]
MMNCIHNIPGQERYNPRIFDNNHDDDEDSVQEFYRANPCLREKEKAQQMENVLGDAISLAERNSGSIICLQKLTAMNAVEFGRRISTFRSMKEFEETKEEDMSTPHDLTHWASLASSRSMQRTASLPTFLKVERGDPAILTQKSWETISRTDSESEDDENEKTTSAAVPVTPSRSWNKLRKTLSREERNAVKSRKKESNVGLSLTTRASPFRLFSRKNTEPEGPQSFAKNSDVEVSLQSEKKRGWGHRMRRRSCRKKEESHQEKTDTTNSLSLTPVLIPMEISREAEEEGFFLKHTSETSMEEEKELDEVVHYEEEHIPMEESMEVVNHGSCFDIIGGSSILKGFETSWKELTEDSFDVVPRPQ